MFVLEHVETVHYLAALDVIQKGRTLVSRQQGKCFKNVIIVFSAVAVMK